MNTFIPEPIASMGIAGGLSFAICHIVDLVRDVSNLYKPSIAPVMPLEQSKSIDEVLNFRTVDESLADDQKYALPWPVSQANRRHLEMADQLITEGRELIFDAINQGLEERCPGECFGCLRLKAAEAIIEFLVAVPGVESLVEDIEEIRDIASDRNHWG